MTYGKSSSVNGGVHAFVKGLFMKKRLLGLAFGALVASTSAQAADLPFKAQPALPPAPILSWTGLYLGVHGGAGWGTVESSVDIGATLAGLAIPGLAATLPVSSHNINGFLAGGTVGYNYQMGNFVLGVEGDISWADIKGTGPCLVAFNCTTKVNWMADVTGRIGVLATERLLVYAKGGVVFADTDYTFGNSFSAGGVTTALTGKLNDTRVGGLFGFGAEYAFMPRWTAKAEYNYMDFGTERYNFPVTASVTGVPPATFNAVTDINQVVHTMKVGVNYKFW